MTIKIHEFPSVLIVDDDPMTRMLVAEAPGAGGFQRARGPKRPGGHRSLRPS